MDISCYYFYPRTWAEFLCHRASNGLFHPTFTVAMAASDFDLEFAAYCMGGEL